MRRDFNLEKVSSMVSSLNLNGMNYSRQAIMMIFNASIDPQLKGKG
jgi:hypothetical protein